MYIENSGAFIDVTKAPYNCDNTGIEDCAEALSRNLAEQEQQEVDDLVEALKAAREALVEAPSETPTSTPSETPAPTPSATATLSATPDEKPEIILEGTDKSYTKGTNATVSVHCTGDLEDLVGV